MIRRALNQELDFYSLIFQKAVWNIYYANNTFIKVLNEKSFEEYGFIYKEIINVLKNSEFSKRIPKIVKIWQDETRLMAYAITKMKGIHLHEAIQISENPLKTYANFLYSIYPTMQKGEEHNIVFKDLITKGNILYDPLTKTASIIDIDGFQIGLLNDRNINNRIFYCSKKHDLFENKKYQKIPKIWTKEMNIFSLYELFLNTIFNQSLLQWKDEIDLEKGVRRKLNEINLSESSKIYQNILKLINTDVPNNIDPDDFLILSQKYTLNKEQKRLILI